MPFKLIQKLEEEQGKIQYEEATKDAANVRYKCDAAMASYRRLRDAIKELAPLVEQTKGLAKGMELSVPIVNQFKVLVRSSYEKEELDKETASAQIQLLVKVELALVDSARQKKDELIRAAGKVDGIYEAALKNLEQVRDYLQGHARQVRFMEERPHLFGEATPVEESTPPAKPSLELVELPPKAGPPAEHAVTVKKTTSKSQVRRIKAQKDS